MLALNARLAAVIGAATVVFIGVPLSVALNVWVDEAFTLHTTGNGVGFAVVQAIGFEAQPPLYFIIEAAWRSFNETSVAFARFPSVLFAAASVATIVFAARRIAPTIPPAVVALVTAVNPLIIWAAVEMRVYALAILIGAGLTWMFYEAFLADDSSSKTRSQTRLLYGACAILGMYTQYYVGFLLIAHGLTLVAVRRSALLPFSAAMAVVALAFAPFLRFALKHVAASNEFISRATFGKAVHEAANAAFAFLLPHDVNWSGPEKFAGFALASALLVAIFVLGRPVIVSESRRSLCVLGLFALGVFTAVFDVSGIPIDPMRHLVVIAPLLFLIALTVLSSLTRRVALIGSLAVAVFALFASRSLWVQYRPPVEKLGEWNRVAATISADDNRATPVAVFPAEAALPLSRYLPVAPVPVPKAMPFTIDYVRATSLSGESQVAAVLSPLLLRSPSLWMITAGPCSHSALDLYSYHCEYLEAYLQQHYRLKRSIAFRGALARLFTATQQSLSYRR